MFIVEFHICNFVSLWIDISHIISKISMQVCLCTAADGETASKLQDANAADRLNSFSQTFLEEVRKGFQKMKQTKND